ncbi:MAG: hypothetical protein ACT4PW_04010 [Acidimicrobiia bacterium]
MRTKTSKNVTHPPDERPFLGLTPNQVVAFNLTRAREWKGWTQDQAAAALEPFLGKRWSKASVSQAERSVAGRVIRNFDADEIVAFARAYDLPITWFFMPPQPWTDQPGQPVTLGTPDAEQSGTALAELIDLVFGDEEQQALLALRLDAFLDQLGGGPVTAAQERVRGLVRQRIDALVRDSFRDLGRWQTQLRSLANQLEDLETRARVEPDKS